MPKNRYTSVTKKTSLDGFTLSELLYGNVCPLFPTEEVLRETWFEHRDEIMSLWIRMFPGTRPTPYWKCEQPKMLSKLQDIQADRNAIDGIPWVRSFPSPFLQRTALSDLKELSDDEQNKHVCDKPDISMFRKRFFEGQLGRTTGDR